MLYCPFCHKEAEDDSIWCRHCGKALDGKGTQKQKWYFRASSLIVGFLLVGPFILPAVWFHPHMKKSKKAIFTVLILLVTFFLAKYTIDAIKVLETYYSAYGIK